MNLFHDITNFIINLWDKSKKKSKLSFIEKIIFLVLCFFEKIYSFCFYITFLIKKYKAKSSSSFKVLSVGNISVGGTGKSVFVQYLINKLKEYNGAILLRGYKGKCCQLDASFLVSNGKEIYCSSSFCGDEALMMASKIQAPIIVGKDRYKSSLLLEKYINEYEKIDYIILDDGYQNFNLKKDFEILLLDARHPFENNHCLPAGKLREKNYKRANIIILTHADLVNHIDLDLIRNNLLKDFNKNLIFTGKHKISSLSLYENENIDITSIRDKRFLAFAGIGSFDSFLFNVSQFDLNIIKTIEYDDHYKYGKKDLDNILYYFNNNIVDSILTTQKDWVKIIPLLKNIGLYKKIPFYILNIKFSFIQKDEEFRFLQLIKKLLK